MKKKETIRSLWTPTAGMLTGARRVAMMLLTTLLLTMTAQTARANYDWYDTSITIGGITADFSQWSRGNGVPDTDLGFLNSLTISSVELKIWDDSNDRGGINMFFRLYGDNGQIGGDVDVWLGGAERIEGSVHDFSVSYTGPFDLAAAFGVTLEHGKTYYLNMWAKSYGDEGDHWYNGDGDNYHTKFTYISDEWDLSTKTLTVKSNPADETYKNRSIIENLIISDGVTSIGDYAFAGCSGLTEITISSSVTSIGQYAFGSTQSDSYKGDHVYVEMPGNKRLSVTIAGVTDPVVIVPTNNNADILDCLFAAPTGRSASRALTLSQFAIWYVNANAAPGGDGKNEGTAFQTLKEVLDCSEYANGDVIMIASGTYTGDQNIGLTIDKSLSFEKYLPPVYTQVEVVFDAQDQGNIWTVETGIDIDISDFTFKNGTITNYGTLTISKSLTLDNSTIKNYGTVQIADGQVLKYTDDGGQVHLLCGTLDADAISALANKDITFFGYGGHCGQDNPETTDVDESKNVMWCISPDDPATADIDESKVLTISGTGLMMYYNSIQNADATWSNGAPWKAFANDIEKVIIKDGITYVGSNTFAHCPNISSVTLPESGLYQIGPGAFADCTSLTSIDIPMSVNNIGDQAFAGCSNLETVSIGYGEAASFTIGTEVFPATTTIFVPKASLSGYLAATDWSTYQIAPAILKSIVTQDNFSNFFDKSGNLQDNTSDELIFQGEFANLVDYILLDRSITITGDNAVLNNMGFSIVSDDVSLNNMTLVSNTDLGYLIYVDASNVTLDNLSVTYNAPSEVEAEAIFANGAENFALTNSEIIFTGANPGENHYRGLEVRDCDAAKIDKNTITATFPALDVDYSKGDGGSIEIDLVLGVGIQGGDNVEFTNNRVTVNTDGGIGGYPTIDAVKICSANDILIKGNNIHLVDNTPEGNPGYYYSLDLYCINGTVEANTISVNTTTDDDVERVVAYPIQLTGPFEVTIKDNNITAISKGATAGIYAMNYYGDADLIVENNNIDVTGYCTTTSIWDLVAGIEAEIDKLKAYNNTITVANGAVCDDTYPVYGVASANAGGNPSADIKDNAITVDGKYAVYYAKAVNANVTGNALCAHELFGDDAVYIKEGSGNTVENNILGYVIPKTGENTYDIPANVSSFKVYDDGGKGRIYSPGCDGTLTLTAPEGYVLQLSGNITTEKDADYLTVYDGSSNQTDVLINQVSSSVSGELTDIPTVTSTGQSMTLYFYSDNSDSGNSEFDGLDLTVTLGKNIAACNITVPNQTMERFGGGDPYPYIYFKFEDAEKNPTSNVIGEVVKDGETTLTLGTDYKFGQITFAEPSTHDEKVNPCKPGDKCLVEIIGVGDYAGTTYATFTLIAEPTNGTWGDLTWEISEDGTLSITGTGAMNEANSNSGYPWFKKAGAVKTITVGEGVTSIAANAFAGTSNTSSYSNATTVNLPSTLTTIGTYAFAFGSALTSVTIPASVTSIGENAFYQCGNMTDVYCYADPTKLTWTDESSDDFKSGDEKTNCHVFNASTWSDFAHVNVSFVGDLGSSTCPVVLSEGDGVDMLTSLAGRTDITTGTEVNVTFSRTFDTNTAGTGKASTVCLPYAVTTPDASVGTFYTFGGVTESGGVYTVTMNAVAAGTTTTAGTPYLFKPAGGSAVPFSGQIAIADTYSEGTPPSTDGWEFRGTFEKITWPRGSGQTRLYGFAAADFESNGTQIGADEVGKFRRFDWGICDAFRCYLLAPDPSSARGVSKSGSLPETLRVVLVGANGQTTAIGTLDARTGDVTFDSDAWYTLDGTKLDGKPTKSGVYINNGKKIVVK